MFSIFPQTERPELVPDPWAFLLWDPATRTYVGRPGALGRERVVSAIALNEGPRQIEPDRIVNDRWGFGLADPAGNVIGEPGVRIDRLLSATWSQDTRRLG
jgi:hypothetical protein